MELKQLEAFVAVVDYNSFSEAARHLFLTQPTVSAHVASLEKELDTKLISRTTKKLHVTPQGYDLYDSAVSMLKIRDHILNEFVGSHKQIIELGASTIPSSYVLPEVLSAFGQLNPDLYFHSELSDSMGIIQQVENGRHGFQEIILLNCHFLHHLLLGIRHLLNIFRPLGHIFNHFCRILGSLRQNRNITAQLFQNNTGMFIDLRSILTCLDNLLNQPLQLNTHCLLRLA